jgi:hypothetical protein
MDVINENSSITLNLTYFDDEGQSITPEDVTYKIYDKSSKTYIVNNGTLTALLGESTLIISAARNAMVNTNLKSETRIVTITWTYNGTETDVTQYIYKINNIEGA